MTKNEILTEAQALLRKGWCKGSFARTIDGGITGPRSAAACSWCALGAIAKASGISSGTSYATRKILGTEANGLATINDNAASVDEVIEYLETLKEPT